MAGQPNYESQQSGLHSLVGLVVRGGGSPSTVRRGARNYSYRRPVRPAPACGPQSGFGAPWRRPQPPPPFPARRRRPLRPETGSTGRGGKARPRGRTGRRGAPSAGWGRARPLASSVGGDAPRRVCGAGAWAPKPPRQSRGGAEPGGEAALARPAGGNGLAGRACVGPSVRGRRVGGPAGGAEAAP